MEEKFDIQSALNALNRINARAKNVEIHKGGIKLIRAVVIEVDHSYIKDYALIKTILESIREVGK